MNKKIYLQFKCSLVKDTTSCISSSSLSDCLSNLPVLVS